MAQPFAPSARPAAIFHSIANKKEGGFKMKPSLLE